MTKQDYQLIASALKAVKPPEPTSDEGDLNMEYMQGRSHLYESIVLLLANDFGDANPRFDRARFLKECGI